LFQQKTLVTLYSTGFAEKKEKVGVRKSIKWMQKMIGGGEKKDR
jgi:hypothetical protein